MEKLFLVTEGDGLKPHLSSDSEGEKSLCGKTMRKAPRTVKEVEEPNPLYIAFVCQKCLKAVGAIDSFK